MRSLSNYIATAWLVILLAGTTIGATVLFAPPVAYAQCSERCKGVVVTLPDKGPIEIDEQVNHPWVKFEFKGTRYLAIEETIEIMPEHTDIYRFVMEDNGSNVFLAGAEKERLKLAEKEKAQLLGNPCVREEIVGRLSWLERNVHPPPILRSPEEARAYNRQRELEDSQPGPCVVPASNDSTIGGNTGLVVTVPSITSVTPIIPTATQTIIIKGQGFGSHPPYVGQNTPYIAFHDNTIATKAWWEAGHVTPTNWDAITLNVGRWTETEIEVTGFNGAYGRGTWKLNAGDQIKIEVWNPQTGVGPAAYDTIVAASMSMHVTMPRITSVTPVTPQADQILIIEGQGFGTHPPFTDQDTPYLAIRDKTEDWEAGLSTPRKTDAVTLSLARWADSEIIVTAFAGAYGTGNSKLNPRDQIEVAVWNAQSGAGPATYELAVNGPPQRLTPPSIRLFQPQVSGLSVSINGVTLPTTPGATIVSITWTFGDGTPSVISWFPVKHSFEHSGSFVVTAVSADSNGRTASASTTVAVGPEASH